MQYFLLNPTTAVRNQYLFFSKLHVLGIQGTKISFAQYADACWSKGYHYFGRIEEERCCCGGVTCSDLLFQTHGRIDYNQQHCKYAAKILELVLWLVCSDLLISGTLILLVSSTNDIIFR